MLSPSGWQPRCGTHVARQMLPWPAQLQHPSMPVARKALARSTVDLKLITWVQRETGAISPGMGQSLFSAAPAAALARTLLGAMSMGVSSSGP